MNGRRNHIAAYRESDIVGGVAAWKNNGESKGATWRHGANGVLK